MIYFKDAGKKERAVNVVTRGVAIFAPDSAEIKVLGLCANADDKVLCVYEKLGGAYVIEPDPVVEEVTLSKPAKPKKEKKTKKK